MILLVKRNQYKETDDAGDVFKVVIGINRIKSCLNRTSKDNGGV